MTGPLMSRDEVAAHLGIDPEYVRKLLSRHGITEQRGYPRDAVENLQRPGQGRRTDLARAIENLPKMLEVGAAEMHRQFSQAGRLMGDTLVELHKQGKLPPQLARPTEQPEHTPNPEEAT